MRWAAIVGTLFVIQATAASAQEAVFDNRSLGHVTVFIKPSSRSRGWTELKIPPKERKPVKLVSPGNFDIIVRKHEGPNRVIDYGIKNADLRSAIQAAPDGGRHPAEFNRWAVLVRIRGKWYRENAEDVPPCYWEVDSLNGKIYIDVPIDCGVAAGNHYDPPEPPILGLVK